MNKVVLLGRTTTDLELKQTSTGTAYTRFTLAVTRKFKNAEGKYDSDFIDCIAWRTSAETLSKYVKKGQRIAIDGALQSQTYEKDGEKRKSVTVVVDSFDFLEKADKSETPRKIKPEEAEPMDDAELPF